MEIWVPLMRDWCHVTQLGLSFFGEFIFLQFLDAIGRNYLQISEREGGGNHSNLVI